MCQITQIPETQSSDEIVDRAGVDSSVLMALDQQRWKYPIQKRYCNGIEMIRKRIRRQHCAFLIACVWGMACLIKKLHAVDQLSAGFACHQVGPFALLPTDLPCVLLLGGSVRSRREYETIHSNLVNCLRQHFLRTMILHPSAIGTSVNVSYIDSS